jgi:hypothetical protein
MNSQLRQLLRTYASRRSPWGPPWWIYGVAFGAANLVRQAAVIVSPTEIPQSIRVASWVATALLVVTVVNLIAVALQRRSGHSGLEQAGSLKPLWPLTRSDERVGARQPTADQIKPEVRPASERTKEETPMKQSVQERPTTSTKWAPWWAYLVIILGANYLRKAVLPDGSTPALRVIVALVVSAVLFVMITLIYRAAVRRDGRRGA